MAAFEKEGRTFRTIESSVEFQRIDGWKGKRHHQGLRRTLEECCREWTSHVNGQGARLAGWRTIPYGTVRVIGPHVLDKTPATLLEWRARLRANPIRLCGAGSARG